MVSRNKRIVAAFAAVAAMGMGLAGCGSDTAGDTKTTDDGGVVNITYMHRLPDSEGMTLVNDIVAKWNKQHPDIQVKATKFDGKASDMIKKLETDVKSGEAPDLAQVGYAELPEVFTKGLLQDVTQYAEQYKNDFASGPYSLVQVGGKAYGLPQDTGPLVYFYNKAEFEKLGITEIPQTADEFIAAAKTAAAAGKYIMSYQPDEAGNMISGLAGASGGWYKVKGDSWVVNTETDGSKQPLTSTSSCSTPSSHHQPALGSVLRCIHQGCSLIGTVAAAWEAPLFMTSSGGTGSGEWQVAQLGDWFGNAGKTGPDGGSAVAVLKNSKHPKEAMEFLDWFNTQVPDLVSQGLVPAVTTEDAETPSEWSTFFGGQDIMKEFKTANNNMGDFTYMPGFSAVAAKMNETAAKATDGSGKVADIFSDAQTTSVDTLKNFGLSVSE